MSARGRSGREPQREPDKPAPPFEPAFGTVVEHYLKAWDLWLPCKVGGTQLRQNLPWLNAEIEGLIYFGGVPEATWREANIPVPEELANEIEARPENQAKIKVALSTTHDKNGEDEVKARFRDDFKFEALTMTLKAIKVFLGDRGILHQSVLTISQHEGLDYYDLGE